MNDFCFFDCFDDAFDLDSRTQIEIAAHIIEDITKREKKYILRWFERFAWWAMQPIQNLSRPNTECEED